jgi:hypothetical protein
MIFRNNTYQKLQNYLNNNILGWLIFNGYQLSFIKPNNNHKILCVGLPRSGTHTLNLMFKTKFQALHEPLIKYDLKLILESGSESNLIREYLIRRENTIKLDFESSHYSVYWLKEYMELWPQAKVILTIRSLYSWVNSYYEILLEMDANTLWGRFENWKLGLSPNNNFKLKEDKISIEVFIKLVKYYCFHISEVKRIVKPSNLLVLNTNEIFSKVNLIESFCELAPNSLTPGKIGGIRNSVKRYDFIKANEAQFEKMLSIIEKVEKEYDYA